MSLDEEVTRLDVPGAEELAEAQALVAKVAAERELWLRTWRELLLEPAKAVVEDFPAETIGCAPGSCRIMLLGRMIARFIVRYREDLADVEMEIDWPKAGRPEEKAK